MSGTPFDSQSKAPWPRHVTRATSSYSVRVATTTASCIRGWKPDAQPRLALTALDPGSGRTLRYASPRPERTSTRETGSTMHMPRAAEPTCRAPALHLSPVLSGLCTTSVVAARLHAVPSVHPNNCLPAGSHAPLRENVVKVRRALPPHCDDALPGMPGGRRTR